MVEVRAVEVVSAGVEEVEEVGVVEVSEGATEVDLEEGETGVDFEVVIVVVEEAAVVVDVSREGECKWSSGSMLLLI